MPHMIQLVIDCHDPHGLADWWADTLDWTVEPQDEAFIHSMIEQGHASLDETTRHEGRLVWRTGAAITSSESGAPRILFQLVPESKAGKNRLHIDVRAGADPQPLREQIVQRGAPVIGSGRQGPHEWVTLTDPEGNEFCV